MIQKGCDGKVMVGGKEVGLVDSWSATVDVTAADITALGEMWENSEAVKKAWSGSISATLDNQKHKDLIDNILGLSAKLDVELFAGKEVSLSGAIMLTGASINAVQGDKTSISFNFKGCGAVSTTGFEGAGA